MIAVNVTIANNHSGGAIVGAGGIMSDGVVVARNLTITGNSFDERGGSKPSAGVYAIGMDGSMYWKYQTGVNGGFSSWAQIGGKGPFPAYATPTIGYDADGRQQVYWRVTTRVCTRTRRRRRAGPSLRTGRISVGTCPTTSSWGWISQAEPVRSQYRPPAVPQRAERPERRRLQRLAERGRAVAGVDAGRTDTDGDPRRQRLGRRRVEPAERHGRHADHVVRVPACSGRTLSDPSRGSTNLAALRG